jgi:hypothetical protein
MILRLASCVFALVFGFATLVQLNDPDPLLWVAVYGLVAGASVRVAWGRTLGVGTFVLLAVLVVLFTLWAPSLRDFSGASLKSFGMSGAVAEEEVREALGLGLALVWTAVLLAVSRVQQRSS